MRFNDYQADAVRTAATYDTDDQRLAIFALGLVGEAGEAAELVKKHLGHGHELDHYILAKEIGDVLWYAAQLAETIGIPLGEIAARNIEKLRQRYPEGFSTAASIARVDAA